MEANDGITLGLRKDGVVLTAGSSKSDWRNVGSWRNIVAIAAGDEHTVGLKSDGTVVTTSHTCTNMKKWSDVIAVACGNYYIGLRSDGTVYEVFNKEDVTGWKNILVPEQ